MIVAVRKSVESGGPALTGPRKFRLGEFEIFATEDIERVLERLVLIDDAEWMDVPSLISPSRVVIEADRCFWHKSTRGDKEESEGMRRCSRHSLPSRRMSTLAGVLVGRRCALRF